MAWVIDVSRCLGLVDLKKCPANPQLEPFITRINSPVSTNNITDPIRSSVRSVRRSECVWQSDNTTHLWSDEPINANTSLLVASGQCDAHWSRDSVNDSNTMAGDSPLRATSIVEAGVIDREHITSNGSIGSLNHSADTVLNNSLNTDRASCCDQDACSVHTNKLNKRGSISTPCLLENVYKYKFLEIQASTCDLLTPSSSNINVNTSPSNIVSDKISKNDSTNESLISIALNRYSVTQSCENLSPMRVHQSRRCSEHAGRRVILSRGDCTVSYSPVAVFPIVSSSANSSNCSATPRSSHQSYGSPQVALDGRSVLMNRVCGGNADPVPPLPATEHPSRPPRISAHCLQHASLLNEQHHSVFNHSEGMPCCRPSSRLPRRAVRSAVGLGELGLCDSDRYLSEYLLADRTSSSNFPPFSENRTSSIRGPPSRAASAGYLLDNLDISEVSKKNYMLNLSSTKYFSQLQ